MLHIASVERETGISKDVLRKWESRYQFPNPVRRLDGDRYYPRDQVDRLRAIKRLMDAGFRPAQVVPVQPEELARLAAGLADRGHGGAASGVFDEVFALLVGQNIQALDYLLRAQLAKQGLAMFVLETIAPLTEVVGEAWADGRLQVHQEHAYSNVVESVLRSAIGGLGQASGNAPRVILATPSGELHVLGILMTQAVLALQGASPIQLGPQVPVGDIVDAVHQYRADVVGLSFSWSYPSRQAKAVLKELRRALDPGVEVWAGGRAVTRLGKMPSGIHALPTFPEALGRLEAIRSTSGTAG